MRKEEQDEGSDAGWRTTDITSRKQTTLELAALAARVSAPPPAVDDGDGDGGRDAFGPAVPEDMTMVVAPQVMPPQAVPPRLPPPPTTVGTRAVPEATRASSELRPLGTPRPSASSELRTLGTPRPVVEVPSRSASSELRTLGTPRPVVEAPARPSSELRPLAGPATPRPSEAPRPSSELRPLAGPATPRPSEAPRPSSELRPVGEPRSTPEPRPAIESRPAIPRPMGEPPRASDAFGIEESQSEFEATARALGRDEPTRVAPAPLTARAGGFDEPTRAAPLTARALASLTSKSLPVVHEPTPEPPGQAAALVPAPRAPISVGLFVASAALCLLVGFSIGFWARGALPLRRLVPTAAHHAGAVHAPPVANSASPPRPIEIAPAAPTPAPVP